MALIPIKYYIQLLCPFIQLEIAPSLGVGSIMQDTKNNY